MSAAAIYTMSSTALPAFHPDVLAAAEAADRRRGVQPSGRGRDDSAKELVYASGEASPPGNLARLPPVRRSSGSSSLSEHDYSAHHQQPDPTVPNSTPELYLPPLLSGLPTHIAQGPPESRGEFDTRLPDIDPASLALHQALHHFRPVTEDYTTVPYDEAFNWKRLRLDAQVEREWYIVAFRSRRRVESSSLSLYAADRAAHAEAVANGGLILYWYGVPDDTGLNLATCIWQSRPHAIKAISGPRHAEAMKQAAGAYETYNLERWVLSKVRGETGVHLRPWKGEPVGW